MKIRGTWSFGSRSSLAAGLLVIAAFTFRAQAQSTNVSFPTPVLTNEISGTVRARDVGDARLTTYYYTFLGNQGDLFINVVTKNFNGDIDVFLADGLKSLTKIVVYSDLSDSETGRVIYLRKTEKLILRVEGRSPNDDEAMFKIKFAGSFEASNEREVEQPELPEIKVTNEAGIRVNSVGTIIEVIPKPTPTPKAAEAVAAETEKIEPQKTPPDSEIADTDPDKADDSAAPTSKPTKSTKKVEVVITDNTPKSEAKTVRPAAARKTVTHRPRGTVTVKRAPPVARRTPPKTKKVEPPEIPEEESASSATVPPTVDPLANIHLVIEFRNGSRIERPMNEVLRVSVDKGILTVVSKDGTTGKYSILEILRTTIQ